LTGCRRLPIQVPIGAKLGLLNRLTLHTTQHRRNMNWLFVAIFLLSVAAACWLLTGGI